MNPSAEEREANRHKDIPVGATVRLVHPIYAVRENEIGTVISTYRSAMNYQCSRVDFPSTDRQSFPNYLLEEIGKEHIWEV
jgi:hypothetical protein